MKYQIYLKKTASDTINAMAKEEGIKPCQMIKALVEGFLMSIEQISKGIDLEVKSDSVTIGVKNNGKK